MCFTLMTGNLYSQSRKVAVAAAFAGFTVEEKSTIQITIENKLTIADLQ